MVLFEATTIKKGKETGRSLGIFDAFSEKEAAEMASRETGIENIRVFRVNLKPKEGGFIQVKQIRKSATGLKPYKFF